MEAIEEKYLMVFRSSNHAALLYNVLLKRGFNVELVSTPSMLSEGCSQSIVFSSADSDEIIALVKRNYTMITKIYKITNNLYNSEYIPI